MNKQWNLIEEIEALKKRELELLAVIEELREALMGFIGNPTLEGYPYKKAAKALAHVEAAANEEAEYYEELNRGYSQDRI